MLIYETKLYKKCVLKKQCFLLIENQEKNQTDKTMKTTEQKLTEPPKSLGRWLMESKRQTQKEMQEEYRNNPVLQAIVSELKKKNGKFGTL